MGTIDCHPSQVDYNRVVISSRSTLVSQWFSGSKSQWPAATHDIRTVKLEKPSPEGAPTTFV